MLVENQRLDRYRQQQKHKLQAAPEYRQEISALMQPQPIRFLVCTSVHVLVWLLAAGVIFATDSLLLKLISVLVMGSQLHAFTVLQHDCGHGSAFRSHTYDLWLGRFLAWFIIMPYTTFKECHRRHHRYFGGAADPDDWNYQGGNALSMFLRISTFVPRFTYWSLTQYDTAVKQRVTRELLFNLTTWLLLFGLSLHFDLVEYYVFIFVLPALLLAFVINPISRGYEHFPMVAMPLHDWNRVDVGKSSITVTSKLIGLLWANINYHVEHHLYPGVPYFNLPRLSQLLADKPYLRDSMVLEQLFTRRKTDASLGQNH